MKTVLLVDDDPQALDSTQRILQRSGYQVVTAINGEQALAVKESYDVVVSDVRMPKMGGVELLRALGQKKVEAPVVLMTAFGSVEEAVLAMKCGAVDFLMKPFKRQQLISAVEIALKRSQTIHRNSSDTEILGKSLAIENLKQTINKIAMTQSSAVIVGESGVGKELVAKGIHQKSPRCKHSFVAINCGAMPEPLMESELFGYEKGAFSGALKSKAGLFEAAHQGTLFLDEIGEMSMSLQVKLLRVLQESEVRRVGSNYSHKVDVRVVCATHQDLKAYVEKGLFREDLYFRLHVIEVKVPPLRERIDDIEVLADYFLAQAIKESNHFDENSCISQDAMKMLLVHQWPGNVRELKNVIERAVVFAKTNTIMPEDLPEHFQGKNSNLFTQSLSFTLGTSLKKIEQLMIQKTLEATDGDKNKAAQLLGVNSRTIYRKLSRD